MLTYIGIIIGCICLVLIAVLGYFVYKKIGSQQLTIEQLVERQLAVEGKILRPPPGEEVQSLLDVDEECEECDIIPVKFDDVVDENVEEIVLLENIEDDGE